MKELLVIKMKNKPEIGEKMVWKTGIMSPWGECKVPVVVVNIKKSWWMRKYRVYVKTRLPDEGEIL